MKDFKTAKVSGEKVGDGENLYDDTIRFSMNYDKWNSEMSSWLKRNPFVWGAKNRNARQRLEKWSEDGSTSISPADAQQPADTDNISALDQSSDHKDTNNADTK